jgi:hypothetical protein
LYDVDDLPLLEIMELLDFHSRLQMMGTCTRFHRLAQHNRNFTKFFKLEISSEFLNDPENCEALKSPYRNFGVIELNALNFQINENYFRIIDELFEKIGLQMVLLVFCEMKLSEFHLFKLLARTGNVRVLVLRDVELLPEVAAEKSTEMPKILRKLEYLQFSRSIHTCLIDVVPDSLKILHMGWIAKRDWAEAQKYLGRQKQLQQLRLSDFDIEDFAFEPELNQIGTLMINSVIFKSPSGHQSFSNFIRAQKNLRRVLLDFTKDEKINGNNYNEICQNVFNKKTLKSLVLASKSIPDLLRSQTTPIPTMEELYLELFDSTVDFDIDCSQIVRLFPNLSILSLDHLLQVVSDVRPLNDLQNLTKLTLRTNDQTLQQLELKSLTSIGLSWVPDITVWENFIRKHSDLKSLLINRVTLEHLQIVLANLPNLEALDCGILTGLTDDNEKLAIQTIGKLHEKLEVFEIEPRFTNPEVIASFKLSFPGMSIKETKYGTFIIRKPVGDPEDLCFWSRKNLKTFYKTLESDCPFSLYL